MKKGDPIALPVRVAGGIAAVWLLALCVFMAAPAYPFAYYKDLGFNWEVVDWALHLLHSPQDLFDAISWSPWYGGPELYLNGYVGDLPTILIAEIVRNSWLAVKIAEVAQVIVAAAGAALLYATFRRSRAWAALYGLLYAAAPATVLLVRWNQDFGWIVALVPGALALSRILVRRYGNRMLPAAGCLCALAGYVIAMQYLLFTSLPLYAAVLLTVPVRRRRSFAAFAVLGAVATVLVAAFIVLPTTAGHPLFSDSAARASTLSNGDFLNNFNETLPGLAGLILREWTEIAAPGFNLTAALPSAIAVMTPVWLVVFAALFFGRSLGVARRLAIVAGACIALALGDALPFGSNLWHLLVQLPLVDSIRTTDRFLVAVPALVLLIFVLGSEEFGLRFRRAAPLFAWLPVAVFAAFLTIDYTQASFTVDDSRGEREPQLDAVQKAVASIGGRTVSLVGVRYGSAEDAAVYGRPAPMRAYADLDLAGRYLTDGSGAAGAFARAGIASVIVGPNWVYDQVYDPVSAAVYRNVPSAVARMHSPHDISVYALPAKPELSATGAACVFGGPGAFDRLDLTRALRDVSFVTAGAACATDAFVDFDPRDAWRELEPEDAWSGSALHAGTHALLDADYHPVYNRTMLNFPWYRNSVDGERLSFDESGARALERSETVALTPHTAWPAGSTIDVRLATHRSGTLSLEAGGAIVAARSMAAAPGFRWYSFVLERRIAAGVPVSLAVQIVENPLRIDVPAALDGVAVLPPGALARFTPSRPIAFVAASLANLQAPDDAARDEPQTVFAPSGALAPEAVRGAKLDTVGSALEYVAVSRDVALTYRWRGPAGAYAVSATALAFQPGTSISIAADAACCGFTATQIPNGNDDSITSAGVLDLHRNSRIVVRLALPALNPESGEAIIDVRLRPIRRLRAVSAERESGLLLTQPLDAASLGLRGRFAYRSDGIHAEPGTRASLPLSIPPDASGVSVVATATGSGASDVGVRCAERAAFAPLGSGIGAVSGLRARPGDRCSLELAWLGGDMAIHSLDIVAVGARASGQTERRRMWLPRGAFRAAVIAPDGSPKDTKIRLSACPDVRRCDVRAPGFASLDVPLEDANDVLLLTDRRTTAPPPGALTIAQRSVERWDVEVNRSTDAMLTELNDTNWTLHGNGASYAGVACDVVNTCFLHVAPGHYVLSHRWPLALSLGIAITAGTVLAAFLPLALALVRLRTVRKARKARS